MYFKITNKKHLQTVQKVIICKINKDKYGNNHINRNNEKQNGL